jgi:uncharacterized membrane protein YdjX (TVP38/TMEM64 family)
MHNTRDKLKIWLPPALLICAIITFWLLHANDYFTLSMLQHHHAQLDRFIAQHYLYSVILFISLYTVLVYLSVPVASFLTVLAGYLYSPPLALLYASVAATLGACLLFKTVKSSLGYAVSKKEMHWHQQLKIGFERNSWSYLLILRLVPLFPFWIVNIATALLNVKLRDFVITTFIGIIPACCVYVLLGHGIQHTLESQNSLNLHLLYSPRILFPMLGLSLLSLAPILYKRLRSNNIAGQ